MEYNGGLPALSATGLRKSYKHKKKNVQILQGLDISLPCGVLSLIKGPSGCGKSTLLAILAGLTAPDAGHVNVLGQSIWSLPTPKRDTFRLLHMGFVFQGSILFPALCAHEQIELVLGHIGVSAYEARIRAQAALDDVGLSNCANLRPDAMSGGEKQRLAIACALAKRPQLIFADEPTSALDSENSEMVSSHLRRLAYHHNVTVICVTHDDRLSPWADQIYHMRSGQIENVESIK